jgi:homoserine dehydrogenase
MATKKTKRVAAKKNKSDSTVKVALLGFGTVGASVARVLAVSRFQGVELTHIFNRNVDRKRSSAAAKAVPA